MRFVFYYFGKLFLTGRVPYDTDLMSPADCAREATWDSTALSLACGSSIHGPHTGIPGRSFA